MSTITLSLGEDVDTLDPVDLQTIQQVVLNLVAVAKRKRGLPSAQHVHFSTEATPLGINTGTSHKWSDWLDEAEATAWR